jgi:hypothetical protein
MNFDWAIVCVLQAYANIAWVINLIVMQVAVDVSSKATYGLRVDRNMRQDNLVPVLILLNHVRPDVIEERSVLVKFEDVVVALNED